jgi:hypothetical protein
MSNIREVFEELRDGLCHCDNREDCSICTSLLEAELAINKMILEARFDGKIMGIDFCEKFILFLFDSNSKRRLATSLFRDARRSVKEDRNDLLAQTNTTQSNEEEV